VNVLESFKLINKVAIITGGNGHLGTQMSLALSEAGAIVIIAAQNEEKCTDILSDSIYFCKCDISSSESIKEEFAWVKKKFGSIDILINNAVFTRGQSPEEMEEDDWKYGIDGCLNSAFRTIKAVIPYFKEQQSGNIVNISSMYGIISPDFKIYEGNTFLNPPHYGAAKAGIIQLTKYYAAYLAKYNVRVNAVSPGTFPTSKVQENKVFVERLSGKNPMGRIGQPNELKGVLVFLSSEASSYITGQNIAVDGGWTIW